MRKPYALLSFGTSTAEQQPTRVVLSHAEFRHEIAVVTVPSLSTDSKRYQSGVPVSLAWGDGPTTKQVFLGYVSHVEPVYDVTRSKVGQQDSKNVVCLGASYLFKNSAFLSLRDQSAPAIVRKVCSTFRFDTTNVQSHTRVWPTLSQSGKSYWVFMAELAEKLGYTMYARGTDLYFHDRLATARRSSSLIPVFSTSGGGLAKFESQIGKTTPDGGELADRLVYGLNPRTAKVVLGQTRNANQKPLLGREGLSALLTQGESARSVDSLQEARDELDALALANQLPVAAKATVTGNPRVRVGGLVWLDGLDNTNGGMWYVTAVKHIFDGPNDYMTRMELGRDAVVAATGLPATPAVDLPKQRGSRLVNNTWGTA